MPAAPIPRDEAVRLEALRRYEILDTPPEQEFDDITFLASQICQTPMAFITFIDEKRQWFKSRLGAEGHGTPREQAFCAYAIHADATLVVPDARADGRFTDNPSVTGHPFIRFYAGAPLRTSEGQKLGTVCVVDRIPRTLTAEQQSALEALARQVMRMLEARYQLRIFGTLIEQSPVAAFLADRRGRYLYVNRFWKERFGRPGEDPIGKTAEEWYGGEIGRELHHANMAAVGAESVQETVEVQTATDGTSSHWLGLRFPVSDVRGEKLIGGVRIDLTRAIEAEERLVDAETKFRTLCTAAPDAIITTDSAGRIVMWNPAAQAMYGYSESEILGRHWTVLVASEQEIAAVGGADAWRIPRQARGLRKDGTEFPIEASVSQWSADGERFNTSIVRDLTERKRVEAQLEHARRTESLGRLAATVAHEFNNVLMGISTFVGVLRTRLGDDSRAPRAIESIARSVERGRSITQDILRFGRPAEPVLTKLELNEWLRRISPELESLTDKKATLKFDFAPEPLVISGDGSQLTQVITNMVANARDAMEGDGEIRISLRGDDQRGQARLSIQDNGPGMPAEIARQIFEPLFTTKRTGTGLGLSVSQRIIEKHRGVITVDTAPGKGTTFQIYLPLTSP